MKEKTITKLIPQWNIKENRKERKRERLFFYSWVYECNFSSNKYVIVILLISFIQFSIS
jgi:hypothetical protein